jgi:hypothetical protein
MVANGGIELTNSPRGLVPIHLGQLAVHQNQIVVLFCQGAQGAVAIGGDIGSIPQVLENSQRHLLIDFVVFDHEQMQLCPQFSTRS